MSILITGASGFIGGSIAARLVAEGRTVRGLIRAPERADELVRRGITPVIGSLDDFDVLAREARAVDAVINAANSDHRGAVEALIEGLAGSGKTLVHTSGSSVIADDARGDFASDRIFEDATPFAPAPEKAARAAIDRLVTDSAARGIASIVLCNSMIYGSGTGMRVDSVQIPPLVALARQRGVALHIGRGLNVWSNVHIEDVVDLYIRALAQPLRGAFCFVENGEASFREIAGAIAARLGLGKPQTWPFEAAAEAWGHARAAYSFGSNSRVRAVRAHRDLGWSPRHASVARWIETEMPLP